MLIKPLLGDMIRKASIIKRKSNDPYRDYCYFKSEIPTKPNGKSILIAPINCQDGHIFEGLFTRKALSAGYRVANIVCDGYLLQCESISDFAKNKYLTCARCLADQKRFCKAYCGEVITYAKYLSKKDEVQIKVHIDNYYENDKDFTLYGVKIKPLLYSALQRYYLLAEPSEKRTKVTDGFLRTIFATLILMSRACKEYKPEFVLSSHGTYSTWGSVVEYCKCNGIRIITWGRNYNKLGTLFAVGDTYLKSFLNMDTSCLDDIKINNQIRLLVDNYYQSRIGIINGEVTYDYNKGHKELYGKKIICEKLNLSIEKPIISVFPNIPWDGQVVGHSTVFHQYKEWLYTTIDFFSEKKDCNLIIRIHPAEGKFGTNAGYETCQSLIRMRYSRLPNNIIIVPFDSEISSYALAKESLFSIGYSSRVGLETVYLGTPFVMAGDPAFKNKGIMYDCNSKDEYLCLLSRGYKGDLRVDDSMKEALYKFTWFYFFSCTMPERIIKYKNTSFEAYSIKKEKDLLSDEVFDYMFNCIQDNKMPNFGRYYQ